MDAAFNNYENNMNILFVDGGKTLEMALEMALKQSELFKASLKLVFEMYLLFNKVVTNNIS